MDEMTQHNAALVEETNAAIEQTEGQAVRLDQIVEQFTVSAAPLREAEPARGIKGVQDKLKSVANTYLRRSSGSAAPKLEDWSEF
jgi:ferritin-like metal-binding protein YciE